MDLCWALSTFLVSLRFGSLQGFLEFSHQDFLKGGDEGSMTVKNGSVSYPIVRKQGAFRRPAMIQQGMDGSTCCVIPLWVLTGVTLPEECQQVGSCKAVSIIIPFGGSVL